MINNLYCPGELTFLNTFDFSYAPSLLFYAYIPIVIISLLLTTLVLFKDRFSLGSKLLFAIAVSFSLWVINIILQWVTVPVSLNYFEWAVTPLFEILIPVLSLYFVCVFLEKKDLGMSLKLLLGVVVSAVAILLPSTFNITSFNVLDCQANLGPLIHYVYIFEILAVLWIVVFGIRKYFQLKKLGIASVAEAKQTLLITIASSLFLLIFSSSNIVGELTQVYEINLYGPIGMVIFLGFLAYMIVRFRTFNVKLFAAQAFVWGLVFFIGAQFFFIRNPVNYFLNGFTFVMGIIFGNYLIKSVKREIEQKEYLATLNRELKDLIKQRENLVHLITHKVKGSFTRSKYIFAEMVAGSFGKLEDMMMKMATKGLDSDNEGIHTVDMVLNAFNLGSGIVKYDMKPMDLKKTVEEVMNEKGSRAKDKGLGVEFVATDAEYKVNGDAFWLKEVVNNFIENSIRYSVKGGIHVKLEKLNDKIRLAVKDEGVGLSEEDKKGLFTEGGRGKDSLKMNVDSTGYGLFSVKVIVQAHGGQVWAESEGRDKGSTFYVELPALA